jgi:23S rRNA (uracil1939-C5)-methyltransferase
MNACHHCDALLRELPSYREQLRQKAELLHACFEDLDLPTEVERNLRVDPSPKVDAYRHTAKLVFGYNTERKEVQLGIYRSGTHRLVDLECCRDHHIAMRPVIAFVKEAARRFKLPVYSEARAKGFLRYFLLRVLPSGKLMCTFVTPHREGAWQEGLQSLVNEMAERFPEMLSMSQNVNPSRGNEVLSEENHLLHGQWFLPSEFLEQPVLVGSTSFMQANLMVYSEILSSMKARLDRLQSESESPLRVADFYCGTGAIGLSIRETQALLLVESSAVSYAPLQATLKDEALSRDVQLCTSRADKALDELETFQADILIVNPPRKGLTAEFCERILKLKIPNIFYLSCNPVTLARDLKRLGVGKNELCLVRAWDMMPSTPHFETFAQVKLI